MGKTYEYCLEKEDILRSAYLPVVNRIKCGKLHGDSSVTNRMMCAGYTNGDVDACQVSINPIMENAEIKHTKFKLSYFKITKKLSIYW